VNAEVSSYETFGEALGGVHASSAQHYPVVASQRTPLLSPNGFSTNSSVLIDTSRCRFYIQ
jgi:hypothetical protein